jgi:hypothetical protein
MPQPFHFAFLGNQISAHTTGTVTPTQNTGKVQFKSLRRPAHDFTA